MSDAILTAEQNDAIVALATTLAGGRHAFRLTDESLKSLAAEKVATIRAARNRERRREAYKWRVIGERFAFDIGYGEDAARISEWQECLSVRPEFDRVLSKIARALLVRRAEKVDNWRDIVRAGIKSGELSAAREWREEIARKGGIPLSLADMRADHGSRFYNYAVRRWNTAYAFVSDIHGADVSDAFQTALENCIQSGNHVGMDRRPVYGALWRELALTIRRAAWANSALTYDAPEAPFSWEEWERTANADIPAVALRSDSANRQTIAEWMEYGEWRAIRDASRATVERIRAERAERVAILDESRRAMVTLINSGMTITRIANLMGLNADTIARNLDSDEMRPASRILPARDMTDSERAERAERYAAEEAHAERLRMIEKNRRADWYANGRVFRAA